MADDDEPLGNLGKLHLVIEDTWLVCRWMPRVGETEEVGRVMWALMHLPELRSRWVQLMRDCVTEKLRANGYDTLEVTSDVT